MNKSKNILITGCSTGLGYDLAKIFLANDFIVHGSVRKQSDADKLSQLLGNNFHPLLFDVTDHAAVDAAASLLTEKIGGEGLAGLINNAGIAVPGPLLDISLEDYKRQFEVNVFGLIKVTQAFLPLLGASEHPLFLPGKVLQISSVAGKIGMPFMSPYVSSKHAVEGVSESLRRELLLYGIDVIVIQPGPIQTPIWGKGAASPATKGFQKSAYAESLDIFENVFVRSAVKKAWTSERAAKAIFDIFNKKKPKVRYALVPERFKNWTLPKIIPARLMDRLIGKKLKLLK